MDLAFIPSPSRGVVELGPIPLRGYAFCIIIGVFVAVWLGNKRWIARGGRPGTVADISVWAVPFGLVGGRLYHVITDYQLYFSEGRDWVDAFKIWEGGLGIWGAIALGAVGRLDRLSPPGHPAARLGRRPRPRHRLRPGHRPLGQLVQPGAVRQGHGSALGAEDHVGGGRPGPRHLPPDVPLRVAVVHRRRASSSSGPTAASSWDTAGRSRCTSPRTAPGAAGSSTCGSTTRTTCSACASTSGPPSRSSCSPSSYFVLSAKKRPGREEIVEPVPEGEDASDEAPGDDDKATDKADLSKDADKDDGRTNATTRPRTRTEPSPPRRADALSPPDVDGAAGSLIRRPHRHERRRFRRRRARSSVRRAPSTTAASTNVPSGRARAPYSVVDALTIGSAWSVSCGVGR